MKNLFIALAFMLIGIFAFANNAVENSLVLNDPGEIVITQPTFEKIKVQTIIKEQLCADIYDVYIDGEYAGTIVVVYEC